MCERLGVPLHVFRWTAATRAQGFVRGALYLVRPDGYLALVAASGDPRSLLRYARGKRIRFGAPVTAT